MTDHSDLIERLVIPMVRERSREPGDAWHQAEQALSSQSLSLSEAREEIERLKAERDDLLKAVQYAQADLDSVEGLKELLAGIRESPHDLVEREKAEGLWSPKLEAIRLLKAEDNRQIHILELLETIREQVRLGVKPEHRPDGLMKNLQAAVYGLRGRMPLLNDAAIMAPLQAKPASEDATPVGDLAAFSAAGFKVVNDDGKRWRIVPDEGDWEMQPVGRVTAGEAKAICEGFVGLVRERDRFLHLWNEERDRNASLSSGATSGGETW